MMHVLPVSGGPDGKFKDRPTAELVGRTMRKDHARMDYCAVVTIFLATLMFSRYNFLAQMIL